MTKIFDLVNFHTAYGDQVRLLDYYYNDNDNREHMRGYVPIRSHREAFIALAQSQLPNKENKEKVFMLTGSYGTGKSHLCLMLANYFSSKPTDPEMVSFFENWAKRDPDGSENIRNMRGNGRYLVAPCDFGEAKLFDEMLISALEKALNNEGAENIVLDTQFKGALSWIEEYEQDEQTGQPVGTFSDFLTHLGGDDPRQALEQLKTNLSLNLNSAMDQFQEAYQKATKSKMQFKNDSLLDILKDLLSNHDFQKRYKGLVFLADEFGYALSEGRVSMSVFQGFAEMSKDGVDGMQLIFIGTGHRRFEAYGANTPWQMDFRVVKDRVTEVSLESEELEQIIAALVSPKTESPIWQDEVIKKNSWLLIKMAGDAKRMKIFDYLDEPQLLEQIVKNIYPAHPMSTYCLTRMSKELGSDARSVFSFFRRFGENPPEGGYSWFVRNFDVIRPSGELSVYTPEFLALYFMPSITSNNLMVRPEIRDHIRNYIAAVEEARRYAYKNTLSREIDIFTKKVLDLIFVFRVSNVNVTQQTLEFGLNIVSGNDKKMLGSELKSLITNKILFQSPSGEYEFRRSNMADLDTLINGIKQNILNQPLNLSEEVSKLAEKKWESWTDAKGHNQDYSGDKRLIRVFATPEELIASYKQSDGSEIDYWELQECRRLAQTSWSERYDGIMVYVLCENDQEIQQAQKAAKSNHITTLIVGVPRIAIPIRESVVNLMAIQEFMGTDEYSKLEFQEKALADDMLGKENQKTGRVGDFIHARERYLEAKGLIWYREDGKTLVAEPVNEYDPADILMNRLYSSHDQASHDYLSKAHPKSFSGSKDAALRDAVGKLVQLEKPVEIDHGEKENRGEIRYLKLALANNNVLIQEGDYDGNIARYELESNPAKYEAKFPGLVEIIEKLKDLKRGNTLNIWSFLAEMTEAPYGLGPYALALFFACAIRHFGDEIRIKVNPAGLGYSDTSDPETIIDVATGKFPLATVERRPLTPAIAKFINEIYNLFSSEPAQAGTQQTLSEAWRAMQSWWKERTRLERAVGVYNDDSSAQGLVDFLTKNAEGNSGSQILLEQVKQFYGYNPDADLGVGEVKEILKELKKDKEEIETRATTIKTSIVSQLSGLFHPEGDTYQEYISAINTWLKNLHPEQKLLTADWQTPSTKTVLEALQKLVDIEKTFLEVIPNANGFTLGKVDNWSYDQTNSYLKIFQDAITKIETSLPKVPAPIFTCEPEITQIYQGAGTVKYHGSAQLRISSPGTGLKVRVTKNEDPLIAKQYITVDISPEEVKVTESCTYFMVTMNGQNETSKVEKVTLTNLDDESKLISEPAPKLDPKERIYRFKNPGDRVGLVVLIRDIIAHLKQDQIISDPDIMDAIKDAIQAEFKK
jgi:hypothetical protein